MSPSLNPAKYQHLQLRSEHDLGVYVTLFWCLHGLSPLGIPCCLFARASNPQPKGPDRRTTIYQGYHIDEPKTGTLNRVLEPVNGLMRSRDRTLRCKPERWIERKSGPANQGHSRFKHPYGSSINLTGTKYAADLMLDPY